MLLKQKKLSLSRNLPLNEGKPAILSQYNVPKTLSSTSDKVNLFAGILSNNSHLNFLSIYLSGFPSRTNL